MMRLILFIRSGTPLLMALAYGMWDREDNLARIGVAGYP